MRDVNKVILLGRLGADPVQRQTKTGIAVVHFPLATARRYYREDKGSGQTDATELTEWHRIVVWGKLGEACAQHLKKGAPVYVEGRLQSHSYEDRNKINRWSTEIYADSMSFLGASKGANYSESFAAAEPTTTLAVTAEEALIPETADIPF